MLPGPLQVGDLLAGRYRLLDPVAADGPAVLWRAQDEVLARDVAVRVLPAPTKGAQVTRSIVEPFLAAASRAGQVTHPGLVRVYDAAAEERPGRGADVVYVIREWIDGEPLDEHLDRVGELAAPDAADVLRQIADALTAAHQAGLGHGRMHPRNVLVTASGRVRVTDAAIAAACHGAPVADPLDAAAVIQDTRDAAAVLYALLTTHWPTAATTQPPGTLVPAASANGHALAPHQLRAAVPRSLDHVVVRALDPAALPTLPPIRTPAALADAADATVADLKRERLEARQPREPGWLLRHWPWGLAAAVVGACAATGWFLGLSIGELKPVPGGVQAGAVTPPTPAPGASVAAPIDLRTIAIRDFDPRGDNQENPDQVRNAIDGDPTTAWVTSRYKTPAFGAIKPGVGLLLDLGKSRALHTVQIGFTAPGATIELRVAASPPRGEDDARVVATSTGKQAAVLTAPAGTVGRYVLLWLTTLPKDGAGHRVGISEVRIS